MKLKRKGYTEGVHGLNTERQMRTRYWRQRSWHVYWKDSEGFHHHERLYCHTRNVDNYCQRLANQEQSTIELTSTKKSRKLPGVRYERQYEPYTPNGPAQPKKQRDQFQPLYTIHRAKDPVFVKRVMTLIERGWLVKVWKNIGFIWDSGADEGLICMAWQDHDNKEGFRIGFSEGSYAFRGYMNGCDNILFDRDRCFDKWSRCLEWSKSGSFEALLAKLTLGPAPSLYPEEYVEEQQG